MVDGMSKSENSLCTVKCICMVHILMCTPKANLYFVVYPVQMMTWKEGRRKERKRTPRKNEKRRKRVWHR